MLSWDTKDIVTAPPQLSVAVTADVSGAGTEPHNTVVSAAQVISGAVLSNTVMICAHEAVFPQASAAI